MFDALLRAEKARFGDVADKYRPYCFEDRFFAYLAGRIESEKVRESRQEVERLRARLANPLLKNPPPY
eukprot:SM000118S25594  [mRNA]  locus=s118:246262:246785:+ [translate_table: standard]